MTKPITSRYHATLFWRSLTVSDKASDRARKVSGCVRAFWPVLLMWCALGFGASSLLKLLPRSFQASSKLVGNLAFDARRQAVRFVPHEGSDESGIALRELAQRP